MKTNAKIYVGHAIEGLKRLDEQSVQTVITSPPYWGLRDYGTKEWSGGDKDCQHIKDISKTKEFGNDEFNKNRPSRTATKLPGYYFDGVCELCGAEQKDKQLGLEKTPQEFIENLCQVFDEVWRVLADDGTLWVNLGDSYAQSGQGGGGSFDDERPGWTNNSRKASSIGLKPKDLVGIPWRFAFAMQDRGWYLRQDIIWAKPNPMPESVTDRCTKSHEYIFLMSKNPRYYYDNEPIREPVKESNKGFITARARTAQGALGGENQHNMERRDYEEIKGANKRSVWTVNTKPYKEAHFATYPTELIEPCILAGSREGDTVLDPFSGSGTTGQVAMQHNRNYIGLELNPDYAKISEKRLHDALGMFGTIEIIDLENA